MDDTPSENPVVTVPKQALATSALLGTAALLPAVKAGPAGTNPPPVKIKALIIVGHGQDSIGENVRKKSKKYFNQAAQDAFRQFTGKKGNAVLVHVKSVEEMVTLIEGDAWDVVLYFGHGVLTSPELMPGYGADNTTLKKDAFAAALKKINAKRVYIFGCNSGYTGLARSLSKDLPGATVYGTFNELDVEWRQTGTGNKVITNRFVLKEPVTEYKNGLQMRNGKKTKQRKREINDPIDLSGDPLGPSLIDQ